MKQEGDLDFENLSLGGVGFGEEGGENGGRVGEGRKRLKEWEELGES